jgi:hypothetical protein
MEGCETVQDFLEVCIKKLSPGLADVAIQDLILSTSDGTLKPCDPLPEENTGLTPLLLTVATKSVVTFETSLSSSSPVKAPHPARKRRWDKLNKALAKCARRSKLWVKFEKSNSFQVSKEGCENVFDFLEALVKETSPVFDDVAIKDLTLSTQDRTLEPDEPLPEENTETSPLLLAIPRKYDNTFGTPTFSSFISVKPPHPARKRRWGELNKALAKHELKVASKDYVGCTHVKWDEVKHVLRTSPYTQAIKELPNHAFDLLSTYLSAASKSFCFINTGGDATRLQFIVPILVCVSSVLEDVRIEVNEDIVGKEMKAHAHFDFVLSRGNKRVYIVVAKKGDMERAVVDNLIGCEVASEIRGLDCVYGIVTDYVLWNFLRCSKERIDMHECILGAHHGNPDAGSLQQIAGKIYAILCSEDEQ